MGRRTASAVGLLLIGVALVSSAGAGARSLSGAYDGTDNSGTIVAKTDQSASNKAVGSTNVNQANGNQNAQAAGNGANAANSLSVSQKNDNPPPAVVPPPVKPPPATPPPKTPPPEKPPPKTPPPKTPPPEKPPPETPPPKTPPPKTPYYPYTDNSGTIIAKTDQTASNIAKDSAYVNQANANQIAQAAGNGASAKNTADVAQKNAAGR